MSVRYSSYTIVGAYICNNIRLENIALPTRLTHLHSSSEFEKEVVISRRLEALATGAQTFGLLLAEEVEGELPRDRKALGGAALKGVLR